MLEKKDGGVVQDGSLKYKKTLLPPPNMNKIITQKGIIKCNWQFAEFFFFFFYEERHSHVCRINNNKKDER